MEDIVKSTLLLEREQETLFSLAGDLYHLYTTPLESDLIFKTEDEYRVAITYLAIAAVIYGEEILAYAFMSNHLHLIVRGNNYRDFFRKFRSLFSVFLSRHGRPGVGQRIMASAKKIHSLAQFRTEIAYVLRNPYVVRDDVNPLSCLQTSGFLYFNPMLKYFETKQESEVTQKYINECTKTRNMPLPKSFLFRDSMIAPESFVNYRMVESLFLSKRQFLLHVFKKVEAQVETALRYGETPVFPDEEMFPRVIMMCRDSFGHGKLTKLSTAEKMQIGQELKLKYRCSNAQISRLTKLSRGIVDDMFPHAE